MRLWEVGGENGMVSSSPSAPWGFGGRRGYWLSASWTLTWKGSSFPATGWLPALWWNGPREAAGGAPWLLVPLWLLIPCKHPRLSMEQKQLLRGAFTQMEPLDLPKLGSSSLQCSPASSTEKKSGSSQKDMLWQGKASGISDMTTFI